MIEQLERQLRALEEEKNPILMLPIAKKALAEAMDVIRGHETRLRALAAFTSQTKTNHEARLSALESRS